MNIKMTRTVDNYKQGNVYELPEKEANMLLTLGKALRINKTEKQATDTKNQNNGYKG